MFQQILVLWDGSDLAEHALTIAGELGDVYDAEVTPVCMVARSPTHGGRGRHHGDHGTLLPDADAVERLFGQRHAGGQVGMRHCELRVLHVDDAAADLLHHAEQHGIDLIVIGHHLDDHHRHLFPHGLTETLVANTQLPVMVVSG